MKLIPVTILTGFLGSGKTTQLNRILKRALAADGGPSSLRRRTLLRRS